MLFQINLEQAEAAVIVEALQDKAELLEQIRDKLSDPERSKRGLKILTNKFKFVMWQLEGDDIVTALDKLSKEKTL